MSEEQILLTAITMTLDSLIEKLVDKGILTKDDCHDITVNVLDKEDKLLSLIKEAES